LHLEYENIHAIEQRAIWGEHKTVAHWGYMDRHGCQEHIRGLGDSKQD
jgi:hypothetical protein